MVNYNMLEKMPTSKEMPALIFYNGLIIEIVSQLFQFFYFGISILFLLKCLNFLFFYFGVYGPCIFFYYVFHTIKMKLVFYLKKLFLENDLELPLIFVLFLK